MSSNSRRFRFNARIVSSISNNAELRAAILGTGTAGSCSSTQGANTSRPADTRPEVSPSFSFTGNAKQVALSRSERSLGHFTDLAALIRKLSELAKATDHKLSEAAAPRLTACIGTTIQAWKMFLIERARESKIGFVDHVNDLRSVYELSRALLDSGSWDDELAARTYVGQISNALNEIDDRGGNLTLLGDEKGTEARKDDFVERTSVLVQPVLDLNPITQQLDWSPAPGFQSNPAWAVDMVSLPNFSLLPVLVDTKNRSFKPASESSNTPASELHFVKRFWEQTASLLETLHSDSKYTIARQYFPNLMPSYVSESVKFISQNCAEIIDEIVRQFGEIESLDPVLSTKHPYPSIKSHLLSTVRRKQADILRSCLRIAEKYVDQSTNPEFYDRLTEDIESATAEADARALPADGVRALYNEPHDSIAQLSWATRNHYPNPPCAAEPLELRFGDMEPITLQRTVPWTEDVNSSLTTLAEGDDVKRWSSVRQAGGDQIRD